MNWLKKNKWLFILLGGAVILSAIVAGADSTPSTTNKTVPNSQANIYENVQVTKPVQPVQKQDEEPSLSNNNYYINSAGNEIHSPAYTEDNSVPAGASARCGDGTYSFSQSRRGTCSHHGGVAEWLY